jgi:hypothetical protein
VCGLALIVAGGDEVAALRRALVARVGRLRPRPS